VPDSFTMRVLHRCDLGGDAQNVRLNRGGGRLGGQAPRSSAAKPVEEVRQRGDAALIEVLERFDDRVRPPGELRVVLREFAEAHAQPDPRAGVIAGPFRPHSPCTTGS
jgi:histidinol dehydrogenase